MVVSWWIVAFLPSDTPILQVFLMRISILLLSKYFHNEFWI